MCYGWEKMDSFMVETGSKFRLMHFAYNKAKLLTALD